MWWILAFFNPKNPDITDILKGQGLRIVLGQIHLVLNKTLTDDTSVKRAQIKTFLCLIQFC